MAILGLGAGQIELAIDKVVLKQGDTFNGTVSLKMKSSVKARGIIVEFWAERKSTSKNSSTTKLYTQSTKLDSEREYGPGESKSYPFSFVVPTNILQKQGAGEGALNTVLNFGLNMMNNNIKWFVSAKLDVPMGFDVSKRVNLSVSP